MRFCTGFIVLVGIQLQAGNGLTKGVAKRPELSITVPEMRRESLLSVSVSGSQAGGDTGRESSNSVGITRNISAGVCCRFSRTDCELL